ncbi:hypothetical protein T440DRAFT_210751 [Plenodomus tracheiphilus IPT5]|uniref:SAC3/GANP/THP3 conserved domain-containing protein n=1 Tax=Plenodomus tracheiphilus IPT5 TaxID=1408161 RepID=A0A6A7AVB9_9PLEO|nr:hypothetical protein T440DRAFT_210751 [Plenodomus tracheiphilus IPT5]
MNPEGQMRLSDSVKLYGICTDMCPEFERVRRIVEEDVKAPECTIETEHLPRKQRIPDESRMVKAYSRSAAGAKQELVSDIRSPTTCLKTIEYLYERLDHDDFDFLHQWLWDRTRAIRKDLRTQRIESKPDISILLTCLERSARFLLLSAHHMARSTKDDYTHQQDIEQLNQTLMSLRERYVDNRRANIPSENEAEFWAYRLILAPIYTNSQLENELHRVPSDLRNNTRVKVAVDIFRALKSVLITSSDNIVQCQSNWKHFWDLIKSSRVSYLMACAAEISFNRMRHVVLDSIWRSYRQGTSKMPKSIDGWTPSRLKEALGLDTESEAVKHCEAYGFVFARAAAGHTYLDFTQKGYQNHVLGMPSTDAELKPQIFSDTIVEAKRYNRALSAVILGMSVEQARSRGLTMSVDGEMHGEEEMEDETSLFVPDLGDSSNRSDFFDKQTNGTGPSSFNPTASPFQTATSTPGFPNSFQPTGTPASSPFTFGQKTSTPQPVLAPITNGIQPGLFDPSKNGIHFSTPGTTNGSAVSSTPSTTPAASGNFFLNGAATSTTPAVNPFASFHTQKAAGSATSATPEVKPAFTSAGFNSQNAAGSATPTAPEVKPAFTSAGFSLQKVQSQGTLQPEASFPASNPPPQSDTPTPFQESQADKNRREAEEKAKREAQLQRKQAEAKEAAQNAMRQKRAQAEAEQQRKQAEAVAQQQRAKQKREEQERRIIEDRERNIKEAQRRQALEEQARILQLREKETAWNSLTMDIMFHPSEGLMMQFIENAALNVAHEAMEELQKERNEAKGKELYRQYQLRLLRAGMAKIVAYIEKKKKLEQARERRRRLKAQRAQMEQMQEQDDVHGQGGPVMAPKPSARESVSQRPALAQSSRRAKRTEERRGQQQNGITSAASQPNGSLPIEEKSSSTQTNGIQQLPTAHTAAASSRQSINAPANSYSKSYCQSTAPIDRTETDWFALKAMGIDPSKHRKRSFDSNSSYDDEPLKLEPKRAKLSPSENAEMPPPQPQQQQTQPTSVVEDARARLRAIQERLDRSTSRERGDINGRTSTGSASGVTNGRVTKFNRESDIIARARKLVASTSASTAITPVSSLNSYGNTHTFTHTHNHVTHDFGRSVPNLNLNIGFATSTHTPTYTPTSTFRSSIAALDRPNAPAYWARTSRFVPRECYGKGPEAVREYREKWGLGGGSRSVSGSGSGTPSVQCAQEGDLGTWMPETQMQTQGQSQMQSQEDFGFGFGSGFGFTPQNQNQNQQQSGYLVDGMGLAAQTAQSIDITTDEEEEMGDQTQHQHHGFVDVDADSEMYDDDDDDDDEGVEGSEDEDEEEELQDYAEYSSEDVESGDEEEDDDGEGGQRGSGNANANAMQTPGPGATQDDAIELSD